MADKRITSAGITRGLVRVTVGPGDVQDVQTDLQRGLATLPT